MVLLTLFGAVALNLWLIIVIPKSFFPEQDTGRIVASLVADQSVSFNLMSQKLTQMMAIVQQRPGGRECCRIHRIGRRRRLVADQYRQRSMCR